MTEFEKKLWELLCMTDSNSGSSGGEWEKMTWDDIVASTKDGTYKNFAIGATKKLDLGSEGVIKMQIVGIDKDELADGTGHVSLSFIGFELLKTLHRMNPAEVGMVGTGAIGGWGNCEMRTYLLSTIYSLIPESVRNEIKAVKKYTRILNNQKVEVNNVVTSDKLWIPSVREVYGPDAGAETEGCHYQEVFSDIGSRLKSVVGEESAELWWLRTAQLRPSAYNRFNNVHTDGQFYNNGCTNTFGIALGFCI